MHDDDDDDLLIEDDDVEDMETAITEAEEPRVIDRRIHPLSAEEKNLCRNVAVQGPDYLRFEQGWSATKIRAFLDRVSVQAELDYLRRTYSQREGIAERTQFFAKMHISKMVPRSLQIVGRALLGDRINEDGTIDRGPTRMQIDAALDILDRSGVAAGDKYKGEDSIPELDDDLINQSLGLSAGEEETPELREKRENARDFLDELLREAGSKRGKKKKKKRGSRKKRQTTSG